jgi:phosphoenolpyruvate---glycerone phosphotransferase subunit DhaL
MTETIGRAELARMVAAAAALIREQSGRLSELDSVAGDGDHGSTMLRTVARLEQVFTAPECADLKTVFHDMGWGVLGVDGGASSSLVGTFFLGVADAPGLGTALDCRALAAAFEAGLAAVSKQTKARPGDKTMMDALVPAVEALRACAEAGDPVAEALARAAAAARAGAEATSNLIARYGRAKFLGEKTRGFQDPGATSIALIFEGFSSGLAEPKGEVRNA